MSVSEIKGHLENEDASVRISTRTGRQSFKPNDGLSLGVIVTGEKSEPTATVGIYGTPEGLLQLADLLTAVAKIDQSQIADRNCPPGEGIHTTIRSGTHFKGSSVTLNVGRLDAKGDRSTTWFKGIVQVCWRPE